MWCHSVPVQDVNDRTLGKAVLKVAVLKVEFFFSCARHHDLTLGRHAVTRDADLSVLALDRVKDVSKVGRVLAARVAKRDFLELLTRQLE